VSAQQPGSRSAPVDRLIWIDGEFRPWADATVHLLSHSLQRGSLCFDYMSVHATARGAAVFRLREHVQRFLHSVELVGLPLDAKAAELEAAVLETVRRNPGASAVKICAYLPSIEVDVVPLDEHVAVAIAAYDPGADVVAHKPVKPRYSPLLRLWIEKELRNRRRDILPPQAKVAANYTSPMLAKWRARRRGYDDILLIDEQGHVAEAPTANVFLVEPGGALVTPAEDVVLLGVTRSAVIEVARHEGLTVRECDVLPDDLFRASEVFLTGTTAGVWPVGSIDDRTIGTGEAGPVALRLRDRLRRITSGEDPHFQHWLSFAGPR
jgi:branched-chain amino acid aminotransferase